MKRIASCVFAFCLVGCYSQAQITSTFDTDADGWTFSNPAGPTVTVVYLSTGGNPNGSVSVNFGANTSFTTQNWIAPSKFLGNQLVRSLGMNLKFDLQQSQAGSNSNINGDVRIGNGSINLVYSLPSKPALSPAWSSYSLKLDETQGWRVTATTGTLATRNQIISVLSNITSLEIRGAYTTNASYNSGLDNVILEQRTLSTPPMIGSLSTTAGKPGDVVTISGSGFDAAPSNNVVFFGGVKASILAASANTLTVAVPAGASFGPVRVVNKVTGKSTRSANDFTPTFQGGGRIIPASFKTRFTIDHAGGMGGLALADIDGDGWVDIVVANQTNTGIRVYRNLGAGGTLAASSFEPSVFFPTLLSSTNGAGLAVRDFDNDGKLDMATSGWTGSPGAFATFRNTSTPGNITFEAVETWNGVTDESPVSAAEDVDGDGLIELVGGEGSSPGATWIIQNISTPGNIEFGYRIQLFGNNSHQGATLADLNGDGKPEFIHKIQNVLNQQNIYVNTSTPGNISFGSTITIPVAIQGSMVVHDFNKDGKNDLAWKAGFSNDAVRIRLNSNTGGPLSDTDFATEFIFDSEADAYGGLTMNDINGDGKPDLLATDSDEPSVFENNFTGGSFSGQSIVPGFLLPGVGATTYPTGAISADLNGDGRPDLVFGTTNTSPAKIVIYENQNVPAPRISVTTVSPLAAPINSTVTITGNNFSSVASNNIVSFGDVLANVLTASPTTLTVAVPPGAGYGPVSVRVGELSSSYHLPFQTTFSNGVTFDNTHFATPINYTLTGADYDIEVGDLDLDGKPDIVAEGSGLISRIFRNTHASGAIAASSLAAPITTSSSSGNGKLFDLDGDGRLDLASPYGRTYPNQSTPGAISFGTEITTASGDNVSYADLNLDGKIDLLCTAPSSGAAQLFVQENRSLVGVFANSGTFGSFSTNTINSKASRGGDVVTADFDNDGFMDAVSTNPFTDNISVYINSRSLRASGSPSTFQSRFEIAVGDNPLRAYPADFDRDGKIDLLVTHWTGTTTTLLIVFQNTSTIGNISFNRVDLTNPSSVTIATVADLDGDGKPEIVTTSESGNRFSIFKNLHTSGALTAASFAAPFNTTVTAPRGITTGDLNLDGKPEIILTRAAGLLVVYENLIGTPLPTITNFSPDNGPVGTVVTITGTNFDPTTSNNAVTLNGTAATVSASTATSLTVTVPAGATTGPISVTVNGYTATSDKFFCVASSAPSTAGLIASYPFNGNANDASGNNNNGTVNGAALTTDRFGIANSAYLFNGTSSFISVPNSASLQSPTTKLTMNAWINLNGYSLVGTSGYGPILTKSNSASSNFMYTFQIGSTPPKIYADVNNFSNFTSGDYSFCLNQWYMVTVVLDVNTSYFYVNGILVDTESFLTSIIPDALPMQIGRDVPGLTEVFNGKLDDIRIYNRALSACEVASLYTPGSTSPSISGFTPPSGAVGTAVIINGTNFDPSPTNNVVSFNGTVASVTAATASSITATVPSGATTGKISVTVNNCITVQTTSDFTVTAPLPTITSFTPAFGLVGTTVTIIGTNFSATPANNTVAFNGTTAVVTASTTTSITVTVPAGATTGKINVTVAGNTATSANDFTITTGAGITITTQPADFVACVGQTATFTTAATGTTNIVYQWQFSPDGIVPFTDISNGGGYANATTATLSVNTTGNFGLGRYRCRINGDFASQVITTDEGLFINPIPTPPTATSTNRCGAGSVTLSASGGTNGQYKWYTVASGGTAIAGEVNSTYSSPSISATTTYFVSLTVSSCESARTAVTATINLLPTAPTATGASACLPSATITLTASGGSAGQYRWYTVATGGTAISGQTGSSFTSPALSATTTYYVSIDNGTCESTRTPVVATLLSCTTPPSITTVPLSTSIGGVAELNLVPLISTVNNPLNISSIVVTVQPASGALASISNGRLLVNYANVSFSGKESVTVRACDNNGNCATQQFEIEVAGDVIVFNAVSPNGANPTFVLQYIEIIPETRNNIVTIFDRWQNEVWRGENYDNTNVVFKGVGDSGSDLPTGTYFYRIDFAGGKKTKTGFISLKR